MTWKRGSWSKAIATVAGITALLAVLLWTASCIGYGRFRSDEFGDRLSGPTYDDDQHFERDYDPDDRWASEPATPKETLVEHRPRPAVDPAASRRADDGPLAPLMKLHGELADSRLSGYALVWEDARLFRSARLDQDSSVGRLGYRPDHWRAGGGRVIPVRVVEDHGRAVEIETISREEARRHCDGAVRGVMDAYDLRIFVPRTELVPVVRTKIEMEYEDGSAALIAPGVAIRATEQGNLIRLAGGAIEVPAPEELDHLGLSYSSPGFDEELEPAPMPGHLAPEAPLRLAGIPIQLRMLPGEAGRPRWVRRGLGGSGSRIFMADSCLAVVLVSDDPDPMSEEAYGGLGLSGLAQMEVRTDHRYEVREGAIAWWPSNDRAGVTRQPARHSQEPERIGELLCFPLRGVVKVCHEPEDVRMRDYTDASDIEGVVEEDAGEWLDDDGPGLVEERPGMWVIEEED